MPKKDFTFSSKVLLYLLAAYQVADDVVSLRQTMRIIHHPRDKSAEVMLRRMWEKGWIKFVNKDNEKFIKLTQNGEIEALLAKARIPGTHKWDGKWRILFYDIPEEAKDKRHLLRSLLKRNNFFKLQASAYINPYPLNREAISYLKQTKLIDYIRIAKVEEMDDDSGLRKKFGLSLGNKK